MIVPSQAAQQQFNKLFEQLSRKQDAAIVFGDFLNYTLYLFNLNRAAEDIEMISRRWTDPEDIQRFTQLTECLGVISDKNGEGFYDGMGDAFMEYVSHGRNGQFFTPHEICDMSAQLVVSSDAGETVCDCACGSGRMLLSAAKINRKLRFYGADIDISCCKMTAINMLLNTMEGEVAWMDTLRLEHWRSWHIKKTITDKGFYLPYFYTSGAGETAFVSRLKASLPAYQELEQADPLQQLSLF